MDALPVELAGPEISKISLDVHQESIRSPTLMASISASSAGSIRDAWTCRFLFEFRAVDPAVVTQPTELLTTDVLDHSA